MLTDPDKLAELDEEAAYARKGNRPTRLKIERGEGSIVRFLPVQMGTTHNWFGRVGRHWYNKKPIGCPRTTSPSMGGSLEATCPVCELAERLIPAEDEVLAKQGNLLAAWPKYLTYVLELERIDKSGDSEPVKARERYTPQALWLSKIAFIELERLVKKSLVTSPEGGLIDPVMGNDIEIRVDLKNNWRLDLLAPMPIREDLSAEDLVAWTEELCASIKHEDTRPAAYEDLEKYARHVEKQLESMEAEPQTGRRGHYDEGEEGAPPASRRRQPAPAPRAARTLPPPRISARPQSQVERELSAEDQAEIAAEAEADAREQAEAQAENQQAEPLPPPPAPRAPTPVARPALRPAPVSRAVPPPPARRSTQPPPESAPDDELAPESRDAAPANEEPPPPPPRTAPRAALPRRPVSEALTRTLNKGV